MQKLISIKKIFTADIFKVSFLNAIAVFIKMLTSFVSMKAVANILGASGPMGIAMLGQLNNLTAILLAASNGGINNGITRYIAEHADSEKEYKPFLGTGFWITAVLSLICGLVLIIGAGFFATTILKDIQYISVFYIFGGTIILYGLNTLLISVINGFKEFKKYVVANILGSIIGLLFTIVLAYNFGIYGALIAAVTYQSIVFILTLLLVLNTKWFKPREIIKNFSKPAAVKLGHYSLMALVTAAVMPLSQLVVRGHISNQNINEAGLWEGINRVSNMFLMVFATSLSVYYLPRLTELKTQKELHNEVFSVFKLVAPLLLIFSVSLYAGRYIVIHVLFTDAFARMESLFPFQVLGDFFKLISWVLAYIMIAKSMTKTYILMEFVSSLSQIAFSLFFFDRYGIVGATIGYATSHLLYLLSMIFIFRKIVFLKKENT
jgi:O-antigen/teichoic acid export membrane protein